MGTGIRLVLLARCAPLKIQLALSPRKRTFDHRDADLFATLETAEKGREMRVAKVARPRLISLFMRVKWDGRRKIAPAGIY